MIDINDISIATDESMFSKLSSEEASNICGGAGEPIKDLFNKVSGGGSPSAQALDRLANTVRTLYFTPSPNPTPSSNAALYSDYYYGKTK